VWGGIGMICVWFPVKILLYPVESTSEQNKIKQLKLLEIIGVLV
jgi:hypothetical protein